MTHSAIIYLSHFDVTFSSTSYSMTSDKEITSLLRFSNRGNICSRRKYCIFIEKKQ